jgi:hypothetical protein
LKDGAIGKLESIIERISPVSVVSAAKTQVATFIVVNEIVFSSDIHSRVTGEVEHKRVSVFILVVSMMILTQWACSAATES